MHGKSFPLLTGILLFLWGMPFLTADIVVRFPTENTALLDNRPQDFYMYVDRNFEGKKSQPWEAGAYGFTRTLVRTQAGPVSVKFHEGIDIKPLRRDASGTPLDDVHPVAGGTVVHASANPTHSNYGRYVVIEHQLKDGPLYSLYAHLASVSCRKGDRVGTGNVIGKLGYSGVGLNKTDSIWPVLTRHPSSCNARTGRNFPSLAISPPCRSNTSCGLPLPANRPALSNATPSC